MVEHILSMHRAQDLISVLGKKKTEKYKCIRGVQIRNTKLYVTVLGKAV
jgi:hypothetical protein